MRSPAIRSYKSATNLTFETFGFDGAERQMISPRGHCKFKCHEGDQLIIESHQRAIPRILDFSSATGFAPKSISPTSLTVVVSDLDCREMGADEHIKKSSMLCVPVISTIIRLITILQCERMSCN